MGRRLSVGGYLPFCSTEDMEAHILHSYFGFGLANGGSAGLVTSFILSWAGFLTVMIPLAELASMVPTSSGQYHWVFILAPRRVRKLLSYLTGRPQSREFSFCPLTNTILLYEQGGYQ